MRLKNNNPNIRFQPVLNRLKESIAVNNGKGSSAYFTRSIIYGWGWSPAYPETTGYIIPTLLDLYDWTDDDDLKKYAESCTDWLCDIQMSSGAFTSIYVKTNKPSIFNTGQILFGLKRGHEFFKKPSYKKALKKAFDWLHEEIKNDKIWERYHYIEGYLPSYYTRVVWAMLDANTILKNREAEADLRRVLYFFTSKIRRNQTVADWEFFKNKPAPTHTIAYTIRGFMESAVLLEEKEVFERSKNIFLRLLGETHKKGKTAGEFSNNWRGNYSFRCVTGNAQLSIIASRFFELTGDSVFSDAAKFFFKEIENAPIRFPPNWRGGIRGSEPFYGNYMRFCQPNWALKFWLDAFLKINKNKNE